MAKEIATRPFADGARQRRAIRRAASRRARWVRKNVVMDQRKLDIARRALGVDTETEAIVNDALIAVSSREQGITLIIDTVERSTCVVGAHAVPSGIVRDAEHYTIPVYYATERALGRGISAAHVLGTYRR